MRIFILLSLICLSVRGAEGPFDALDADHASLQEKIAQLDIMVFGEGVMENLNCHPETLCG